jgi:hypothetical protein
VRTLSTATRPLSLTSRFPPEALERLRNPLSPSATKAPLQAIDAFELDAKPVEAAAPEPRPRFPVAKGPKVQPHDPALLDGLQDEALLTAIRALAYPHTILNYSMAKLAIYSSVDNRDGIVRDVYMHREVPVKWLPRPDVACEPGQACPEGDKLNLEHTFPRSRGVRFKQSDTDMHHLFPVDADVNQARKNFRFGEVVESFEHEQLPDATDLARVGYDSDGAKVFEVPDEHKGNVARAIFYISTVYGLKVPDDEEAVLRQWNDEDPVDAQELWRNEEVSRYQSNRNPFIDEAGLEDRIADF